MNPGKYTLVNGQFVVTEEFRLTPDEFKRILFSEKIRSVRTAFPFFNETLELIKLKLRIFNQAYPEFTKNNGAELKRQLQRTLTRNKLFMGAVFTLSFSLTGSEITYTIRSEKLPEADYGLNEKGLYAAIFSKIQKPVSALSNLTTGSEIYWNISQFHLDSSQTDCLFIPNTAGQVIESPGSNIYLIEGNKIRGASVDQGAFRDVTYPFLLEIFGKLSMEYSESKGITVDDVRNAEEIFLADSIEGIRWVVGFEDKRYYNNTIRKISEIFGSRSVE